MTKSTDIRARIEPERKQAGKQILAQLGITESEFIQMAWAQLLLRRGVPFEITIPDEHNESIPLADFVEQHRPADAVA